MAYPYDVTFALELDGGAATLEVVKILVDALFRINVLWLRAHPEAPRLGVARIPYVAEARGEERFQGIPVTRKRGRADCEDLATELAAEMVVRDGIQARPEVWWRKLPNGEDLFHVVVRLPDGSMRDPSREAGMP